MPHRIAHIIGALLLPVAAGAHAQDEGGPMTATDVPTLERVQAVLPEQEAIDLYRFKNPVTVDPGPLSRAYRPGPSLEKIALEHGGLIQYGIDLGLAKTWRGFTRITRMRPQSQDAIARPPPLSEDQLQRAAGQCQTLAGHCDAGQ